MEGFFKTTSNLYLTQPLYVPPSPRSPVVVAGGKFDWVTSSHDRGANKMIKWSSFPCYWKRWQITAVQPVVVVGGPPHPSTTPNTTTPSVWWTLPLVAACQDLITMLTYIISSPAMVAMVTAKMVTMSNCYLWMEREWSSRVQETHVTSSTWNHLTTVTKILTGHLVWSSML